MLTDDESLTRRVESLENSVAQLQQFVKSLTVENESLKRQEKAITSFMDNLGFGLSRAEERLASLEAKQN
jgi:septal ring factor EnvC (AmiA/AmiB activator)